MGIEGQKCSCARLDEVDGDQGRLGRSLLEIRLRLVEIPPCETRSRVSVSSVSSISSLSTFRSAESTQQRGKENGTNISSISSIASVTSISSVSSITSISSLRDFSSQHGKSPGIEIERGTNVSSITSITSISTISSTLSRPRLRSRTVSSSSRVQSTARANFLGDGLELSNVGGVEGTRVVVSRVHGINTSTYEAGLASSVTWGRGGQWTAEGATTR